MRHLYCPICANEIEWHINEFRCASGPRFSPKLGNLIKNAAFKVDSQNRTHRQPTLASYLWCPNCTGELEEYDDKQKRLKCHACGLELPALAHFELMQIKEEHQLGEPIGDK